MFIFLCQTPAAAFSQVRRHDDRSSGHHGLHRGQNTQAAEETSQKDIWWSERDPARGRLQVGQLHQSRRLFSVNCITVRGCLKSFGRVYFQNRLDKLVEFCKWRVLSSIIFGFCKKDINPKINLTLFFYKNKSYN